MKLRQYLKDNGISQRDFAKTIGVGFLSVWRYLQAETSPNHRKPEREVLLKIAKATGGQVLPADFGLSDSLEQSA